jgi:hypothetical protein
VGCYPIGDEHVVAEKRGDEKFFMGHMVRWRGHKIVLTM